MASKQAKNLGRLELLAWLNDLAETDYPKIEACSDAVGFCQVLDAIAPSSQLPMHRLRFNAASRDDKERNLRIFHAHVQKLRLPYQVDVTQLANGRFQHNIECLQFLYDHHMRVAPKAASCYNGFERRMEAYKKQHNIQASEDLSKFKINMNSHLIPNKANCRTSANQAGLDKALQMAQHEAASVSLASSFSQLGGNNRLGMQQPTGPFKTTGQNQVAAAQSQQVNNYQTASAFDQPLGNFYQHDQQEFELPDQVQKISSASSNFSTPMMMVSDEQDIINQSRQKQLQDLVQSLENELTTKLFQHKTFLEEVESVEEERNFYYNKLRDIETEAHSISQSSQVANYVIEILKATPEDFKQKQHEMPRRETFGRP